ncbi:hypothetical protein Hanom_Chr12g01085401 [Helianthus anomalus]
MGVEEEYEEGELRSGQGNGRHESQRNSSEPVGCPLEGEGVVDGRADGEACPMNLHGEGLRSHVGDVNHLYAVQSPELNVHVVGTCSQSIDLNRMGNFNIGPNSPVDHGPSARSRKRSRSCRSPENTEPAEIFGGVSKQFIVPEEDQFPHIHFSPL